ncbi:DUF4893 domain-containing protein [Inquilinus sp.]|jgi:hypothetical protein|uniref:DUF4893 domain-containing protein n=1 Tax=Inquilinus sp. TaxID=1932117 RepID=UPI003783611A
MMRHLWLSLVLFVAAATPALADGTLASRMTAADTARLAAFDTVRAQAIGEARASDDKAAVAVLDQMLAGTPQPIRGATDLAGTWRCRVAKLGGILPLTIYDWFRCRITDDSAGLRLDKVSGSQRTAGGFYDDADAGRLVFLGALYYGHEGKPVRYGTDAERDQVGYLVRVGRDRLRLEYPSPRFESHFDIMELERPH